MRGCCVTKFVPYKDVRLIARGKLTFDEWVVPDRVFWPVSRVLPETIVYRGTSPIRKVYPAQDPLRILGSGLS